MGATGFPALLQCFFIDRLGAQLGASPHTVASYRDTFRLLLAFASDRLGRAPSEIRVEDLDVSFLGTFLDDLEQRRANSIRSRNVRLTAVRAFFRYAAFTEPAYALLCQRVLAMPSKRYEHHPVEFLTEQETAALLAAPDLSSWIGRRDHALLFLAVETGLRNAEIRSIRRRDVQLGTGAHVRCTGKGRKTRCTPLRRDVAACVEAWLAERGGGPDDRVFVTARGGALSSDALQRLVARYVLAAHTVCPSLVGRKITPHTLRHTMAMAFLRRGIGKTTIALWLGHESSETTEIYVHADMSLKERPLAHVEDSGVPPPRFQATDSLLAFLATL